MTHATEIPKQVDLMWPIFRALEGLGGSASIQELDDRVSTDLRLPDTFLQAGCVSTTAKSAPYPAVTARQTVDRRRRASNGPV